MTTYNKRPTPIMRGIYYNEAYYSAILSFCRLTLQTTTLPSPRNFTRFLTKWQQPVAFLALAQRRAFSTTTDLIPRLESMLTNQSSTIPDLCCLSGEEYILLKFKLHILIYITMSVEVMGLINKDVLSNLMFCALNKDRKLRTSTSFWRKKSALCHHSNVCSQRFF